MGTRKWIGLVVAVSFCLMAVGAFMKIQHWPGASFMLMAGGFGNMIAVLLEAIVLLVRDPKSLLGYVILFSLLTILVMSIVYFPD